MRNKLLLLLAVILGLAITVVFVIHTRSGTVFGAFEGGQNTLGTLGVLGAAGYGFLFTLIGVTLGVIYRHLLALRQSGQKSVRMAELVRYLATSIDYKIALVGAPIVFGLIWRGLGETPIEVYTVIALENGFVANAIVSQFIENRKS